MITAENQNRLITPKGIRVQPILNAKSELGLNAQAASQRLESELTLGQVSLALYEVIKPHNNPNEIFDNFCKGIDITCRSYRNQYVEGIIEYTNWLKNGEANPSDITQLKKYVFNGASIILNTIGMTKVQLARLLYKEYLPALAKDVKKIEDLLETVEIITNEGLYARAYCNSPGCNEDGLLIGQKELFARIWTKMYAPLGYVQTENGIQDLDIKLANELLDDFKAIDNAINDGEINAAVTVL